MVSWFLMMTEAPTDPRNELRALLAASRIPQIFVAARMGMDHTQVSRILSGERRIPDGFEARFREAHDLLVREQIERLKSLQESRR